MPERRRARHYYKILLFIKRRPGGSGPGDCKGSLVARDSGWKYTGPRRLLTFALDAKAVLPLSKPPALRVNAQDNPAGLLLVSLTPS